MPIKKVATDTTMMLNDIRELEEIVELIKNKIQSIKQEVSELDAMWDGSAKVIFNSQFEEDYERLQQALISILEMIDNMKLAEREYTKCEEGVSDIIKNVNI